MEPTIYSVNLLLVDRIKLQVRGERIYLINLNDEVMVKRIEWLLGSSVIIRGDNTLVSRDKVLPSKDLEKLHILSPLMSMGSKI